MYTINTIRNNNSKVRIISSINGCDLFSVKNAIISPTHSGVGIADVNRINIFKESIETDSGFEQVIQDFKKIEDISMVNKKRLYLSGFWSTGFWHWIFEFLPKAILAENCGYDGDYVIPSTNFAKESLILLGINEDRIISKNNRAEIVEELLIVPRLRESNIYNSILFDLKSKLELNLEKKPIGKRLYIKRDKDKRGIVNEEELCKLLNLFKFETWIPENSNIKKQIQTAMSANILIGPHGAGMTHALFLPKYSLILELFSPKYINPCIFDAIKINKHRYFIIPSDCNYKNDNYPFGRSIVANTKYIEHILNTHAK